MPPLSIKKALASNPFCCLGRSFITINIDPSYRRIGVKKERCEIPPSTVICVQTCQPDTVDPRDSHDEVAVRIASVYALSHWEDETTIRNYLTK